jgi:hypothetical protein
MPTLAAGFTCNGCSVSAPTQEPGTLSWDSTKSALSWAAVAGSTFYNVYRGAEADLASLLNPSIDSCRRLSVTTISTGVVLTEVPPSDTFYWYLIRAANGGGEGPAGNATAGPRIQDSSGACP